MSPRRRDLLVLAAVGGGAAIAGGVIGALALQSRSGAAELLSHTFTDLAGQPQQLLQWKGRALVCNFWATWCAPCREEMPLLESVGQQHGSLQVVGIAIDKPANIRDFLAIVPVSFPILVGGPDAMALMRRLGNGAGGLPFTVLLDRHGALRGHKLGAYQEKELYREVEALLR